MGIDMTLYMLGYSGEFALVPSATMIFGADTVPILNGKAEIKQLRNLSDGHDVSFKAENILEGYLVCQHIDHDGLDPNIINTTAHNRAPQKDTALVEGMNKRNCIVFDWNLPINDVITELLYDDNHTDKWAYPGDTLTVRINTMVMEAVSEEHDKKLKERAVSAVKEVMDYFDRMPGAPHVHSTIETEDAHYAEDLYGIGEISIVLTGDNAGQHAPVVKGTHNVNTALVYVWNGEPWLEMDYYYARLMLWRIFAGFDGLRKSTSGQGILWGPVPEDRRMNPGTDPLSTDWATLGFFRIFDAGTEFKPAGSRTPPASTEAREARMTATGEGVMRH
ncbi:MAG: hypothetical protein Q8N53_08185 [Longimicrobiales bacterium]|nr:hypothetical protein [Longimicrobiales bacterium]